MPPKRKREKQVIDNTRTTRAKKPNVGWQSSLGVFNPNLRRLANLMGDILYIKNHAEQGTKSKEVLEAIREHLWATYRLSVGLDTISQNIEREEKKPSTVSQRHESLVRMLVRWRKEGMLPMFEAKTSIKIDLSFLSEVLSTPSEALTVREVVKNSENRNRRLQELAQQKKQSNPWGFIKTVIHNQSYQILEREAITANIWEYDYPYVKEALDMVPATSPLECLVKLIQMSQEELRKLQGSVGLRAAVKSVDLTSLPVCHTPFRDLEKVDPKSSLFFQFTTSVYDELQAWDDENLILAPLSPITEAEKVLFWKGDLHETDYAEDGEAGLLDVAAAESINGEHLRWGPPGPLCGVPPAGVGTQPWTPELPHPSDSDDRSDENEMMSYTIIVSSRSTEESAKYSTICKEMASYTCRPDAILDIPPYVGWSYRAAIIQDDWYHCHRLLQMLVEICPLGAKMHWNVGRKLMRILAVFRGGSTNIIIWLSLLVRLLYEISELCNSRAIDQHLPDTKYLVARQELVRELKTFAHSVATGSVFAKFSSKGSGPCPSPFNLQNGIL
ncbi:hypothetical protein BKA64DRAFT_648341 [Cadophora sp. MPI-SDFR-AT-0126]|nr:hypothetical protein BKA64DRAFT_648341 [Leotiomycetes sp. MPI-SDFR-AT-0126]